MKKGHVLNLSKDWWFMKTNTRNYIIDFFLGLLCLSPFSTYLSHKLGLPIGLPELFGILLLPFYFQKIPKFRIAEGWYVIISFLIILGLISTNTIYSVLGTSRIYIYILIFAILFSKVNKLDIDRLFMISFGAVIGGALNTFLLVKSLGQDEVRGYSNFIALALFVLIPLLTKKKVLFIICLSIAVFIATYSGLRRQLFQVLLSAISGVLLMMIFDPKEFLKASGVVGILSIFTVANFNRIEDYLFTNHFYLWQRFFSKTRNAVESQGEGEGSRFDHFGVLLDYLADSFLPRGFYPRGTSFSVNGEGGSTLDFPFYELIYMFGAVGIILLLLFGIVSILKSVKVASLINDMQLKIEVMIIVCCFPVIFASMFFDGSFIQYSFVAPMVGLLIGRIVYYNNIILIPIRNSYLNS